MKIEILFPEFCNLFGDSANGKYIAACLPEAEIIRTAYTEEPRFLSEDIDLVLLGSMTENKLTMVINKLMPFRDKIMERIEQDKAFFVTGNAMDIFGKYIEGNDGSKEEALGLFDFYTRRDLKNRFNGVLRGAYEDIEVIGFKTQFSMAYSDNFNAPFIKVKAGVGMNKNEKVEGIHYHNFYATYLLGPFLIINPMFTKKLLKLIGAPSTELAYEEAAMEAYETRMKEFDNPKLKYDGF